MSIPREFAMDPGRAHSWLARLMSRISRRISSATLGRPDIHRQNKRNLARCQRMTVSGLTITKALRTPGAIRGW